MDRTRRSRTLPRVVLPILVLVAAVALTAVLVFSKREPEQREPEPSGPLVEVVEVRRKQVRRTVAGHGTVAAARELSVQPQVTGQLEWIHPALVPGGVVRAGETLFRIDPADYRLNLEQSLAQLARARSELEMEKGRHRIAQIEWEQYQEDFSPADPAAPALAKREPQLEAAEVNLRSSRAEVAKNRVALERTTVRAPFDAVVDSEVAETGLLVTPQTVVARLLGIERFWVQAVIPVDDLAHVTLPGPDEEGAAVLVRQETGGAAIERPGRVTQVLGRLEEQSRFARIVVEVEDPLGLSSENGAAPRALPLLVGAYVEVEIEGAAHTSLIEVPREALHDRDRVYVFEDDRLEIRGVSVAWRRSDVVFVDAGLEDGDQVVVSRIPQPLEGMPLRALPSERRAGDDDR